VVALAIGTIELLSATLGVRTPDLGRIGLLVVLLFVGTAAISLLYWKVRRVEERWT
jgi:hypothetical protein